MSNPETQKLVDSLFDGQPTWEAMSEITDDLKGGDDSGATWTFRNWNYYLNKIQGRGQNKALEDAIRAGNISSAMRSDDMNAESIVILDTNTKTGFRITRSRPM